MSEAVIRRVGVGDRALWEPMWAGYLAFYQRRLPPEATEFTWKRLSTGGEIEGLVAVSPAGEGLGLVHFLYHASTVSIGGNCYLQDLFVSPVARNQSIGRRLILAVADAARARQAALVYWQTEEFNGTARRVYERVAKRAPFIRYNLEL
ncbi:MAG TPA: GNAT family N-acetyltransferase [Gammaproteobacteria bacterium]|nr:GNAT family N-acetyltransferase [Gammaproteobacteria bacterium]